nr:unnamed protein product [Callosobruchus analis]
MLSGHRTVLVELTTLCGKNLGHEIYYSRRYDDNSVHNFTCDVRFRRRNTNKWVTDEVVTSSKEPKNLFSLAKVLPEKKKNYLDAKKLHQRLVGIAKRTYYQNKVSHSQNINKTTWSIVSELTRKEKNASNFSIKTDKGITTNSEEIANHFNTYFKHTASQVISKTAPRINMEHKCNNSNLVNYMLLYPFTEQEFELMHNKLINKSSAGSDKIPGFLLKKVLYAVTKPLMHLLPGSIRNTNHDYCLNYDI